MQNPRQYKIPDWFLNRQKDIKDGKYSQVWLVCSIGTFLIRFLVVYNGPCAFITVTSTDTWFDQATNIK